MRLAGKVALVTGGGSGIGRGICVRFAEEGADVVAADMNRQGAEATADEARRMGRRALALEANVTSRADCERIVRETIDSMGKLDIFVANAGIGRAAAFLDVTEDDWNAVIDTNLSGVFFSCQAAARQMVSQGHGGRIITMASVAAEQASGFMAAYHSSKAAVRMLTKVMAIELGPHRITVNALAPGVIETPLTVGLVEAIKASGREVAPLGRLGEPKDVADVALFLASDEADYVTGGMIFVDGGMAAGRRMG
ncbi:MAG: SDR family NAD(P)-dependent oxidoreductase [Dehalococcoidia bacterium]